MRFDMKLVTGIFVGMVLGLHYVETFMVYLPILTLVTIVLVLRAIHH